MKSKNIIYMATSVTSGKAYVGMTTKSLAKRKSQHEYTAMEGSCGHFHKALVLYGFNDFRWVVLDTAESHKELAQLEILWIKRKNTFEAGYNMTTGGEQGIRGPASEETKRKMRESSKKRWAKSGFKMSEETKQKISASKQGHLTSQETREKMSLSKKNMSEETKRKMSESQKKRRARNPVSPETKRKMAESAKKRWAAKKVLTAN